MARFVLRGSILKIILIAFCLLGSAFILTPAALAQHGGGGHAGGGHMGGGGHFGGGGHVGAPHIFAPRASHAMISRPRGSVGPLPEGAGTRAFRFQQRPIYVFRHPRFFGPTFYRFGFGLGFNSLWWPTCDPFWGWGFNCFGWPSSGFGYGFGYGYGYGNYVPPQTYDYPVYLYSGEGRELPQLYLKDGTVYDVTDYWFVDGQIHFTLIEEGGAKSVEQVIDLDELDLQRTIDVNTQRGFRFVLRNEPAEQYLKDHPGLPPPVVPPPKNK
jgi:hypothetical protein